jgi:hypothetical protein
MPSEAPPDDAWAAAHVALVWQEARAMRDARWRRNAWCLVSLVVLVLAGAGPVKLHEVLPLLAVEVLATRGTCRLPGQSRR